MPDNISLLIHNKQSKNVWELQQVAQTVHYETHLWGTPGKLTFTYLAQNASGMSIQNGDFVKFSAPDMSGNLQGIFVGFAFSKKTNRWGEVSVTCYDQLRYLKSDDSIDATGLRADQLIQQIASKYNLVVGTLANTSYVLQADRFDNTQLSTMIQTALQKTNITLAKAAKPGNAVPFYVFYDSFGKLYLTDANQLTSPVVIGASSLLTDYDFTEDIDTDTYNVVKLVRSNKTTGHGDVYEARDSGANLAQWGTLQYYEVLDDNVLPGVIGQRAKELLEYFNRELNTLSIKTLGVVGVRAGTTMWVQIPDLAKANSQAMMMDRVVHTWEDSTHEMELEMRVLQ